MPLMFQPFLVCSLLLIMDTSSTPSCCDGNIYSFNLLHIISTCSLRKYELEIDLNYHCRLGVF
jgi:hypothetical protein